MSHLQDDRLTEFSHDLSRALCQNDIDLGISDAARCEDGSFYLVLDSGEFFRIRVESVEGQPPGFRLTEQAEGVWGGLQWDLKYGGE